jgi:predicted secreted protein
MRWLSAFAGSLGLTLLAVTVLALGGIVAAVQVGGLSVTGAVSLYFVAWWIALFAILPLGASEKVGEEERLAGADAGAPARPMLREKAVITTLVADAILLGASAVFPLVGL